MKTNTSEKRIHNPYLIMMSLYLGAFVGMFGETAVWYVILCHVIMMIGIPLVMSPSQSTGLSSLPRELNTDGSAILNTLQQVWGAVCTAVATSLLGIGQAAFGSAGSAEAFTNGFHYGLVFILILAIIGFILGLKLNGKKDV